MDKNGNNITLGNAYVRFLPFLARSWIGLLSMLWLFSTPEFENTRNLMETRELMSRFPYRFLATLLNYVVLADCVMAAFAHRKRALHDIVADSYCVRRPD